MSFQKKRLLKIVMKELWLFYVFFPENFSLEVEFFEIVVS